MRKNIKLLAVLLLLVFFINNYVFAETSKDYLIKVWNVIVNKVLLAYNSENYNDFRSCFADALSSAATKSYFEEIYLGTYKKNLGFVESVKFLKNQSSLDSFFPVLLYQAQFEKYKDVLITVNFANEDGRYRITSLRFDKQYSLQE
jgi:hypothetical protein